MASRIGRETYFDEVMQRDCQESDDGDMVFPIDHNGAVDDNENNVEDNADMVFEMDDPDFDEPHSDVSGATPTSYNVFNFHSRSMSHSLSSAGGGMRVRPPPPRPPHSLSRSNFSAASATRPTLQQRPVLQTSQTFPLSALTSRHPLVVPFSPSQTVVQVTGGRDTFMGFHQGDTDGDESHVYFETPAFASASARAHELQQAQYYDVQTQAQGSSGPMSIPSPSSHSGTTRQQLHQRQNSQPHHVPGQLHPHHPQHSRYYHTSEAETLARQSLESSSHPFQSVTTAHRTARAQPPFAGHEAQAYWSTNMVLSTTESVGIDPAKLVNPCSSLPSLVSCQTPVANGSPAVAVQNQKVWIEQQEKEVQEPKPQQLEVEAAHQKSVEQQAADIQRQQELLVSQRRQAQLQHLAQLKEDEQTRKEKENEERRKKEVLDAQAEAKAEAEAEAQEKSTSVHLYESFLALRAVLETEQRRQKPQLPPLPPSAPAGQTPLQVTLNAGIQKRAVANSAREKACGKDQRSASKPRSGPPRSAPPLSSSPFVPPPPDNVPLPALPHDFPHPPRRPPVARPPAPTSSSSTFRPSPLAAPFIPSIPSIPSIPTPTSETRSNPPAQPVIAYGSKPYRSGYVPVADRNQNQKAHAGQNEMYYQYHHYTYQPMQSASQQVMAEAPQSNLAHETPASAPASAPAPAVHGSTASSAQQEQTQQEQTQPEQPQLPPPSFSPLVIRRQLTAASSHRSTMYTPYAPYDRSARPRRRHTRSSSDQRNLLHPPRDPRALRAARAVRPSIVRSRGQSTVQVQRTANDRDREEDDEQPGNCHHGTSPSPRDFPHDPPSPGASTYSSTSTTFTPSPTSTTSTRPTSAASSMPSPGTGGAMMMTQTQGPWVSTMTVFSPAATDGYGSTQIASPSVQTPVSDISLHLKPAPSLSLLLPITHHHHHLPAFPDARSRQGRRLADKASLMMTPIVVLPFQKLQKPLLVDEWSSHPSVSVTAIDLEEGNVVSATAAAAAVPVSAHAEPPSPSPQTETETETATEAGIVGTDSGGQMVPVVDTPHEQEHEHEHEHVEPDVQLQQTAAPDTTANTNTNTNTTTANAVAAQPPTFAFDHPFFTPGQITLLRMPPSYWIALFQFSAHQAYIHHCQLAAHMEARRQAWKRSVPSSSSPSSSSSPPPFPGLGPPTSPSRPWHWTWTCLCRRRHVVLLRVPRFMGGPQWCDRCGEVEPVRGEDEGDDVGDDDDDEEDE